jgi:hypothetical protein
VVSPEDLILSKLVWAKDTRSEIQLRDVRCVIEAQPTLDWSYVVHWGSILGVSELLQEIRT